MKLVFQEPKKKEIYFLKIMHVYNQRQHNCITLNHAVPWNDITRYGRNCCAIYSKGLLHQKSILCWMHQLQYKLWKRNNFHMAVCYSGGIVEICSCLDIPSKRPKLRIQAYLVRQASQSLYLLYWKLSFDPSQECVHKWRTRVTELPRNKGQSRYVIKTSTCHWTYLFGQLWIGAKCKQNGKNS